MQNIIQFSLKNKFAVWLMTIIVAAAGLYAGTTMKLETIPNINTPLVSVMTVYPGAAPEQVADKVSEPIEKRVQNLDGVTNVSSTSFQNASSIQIEYNFDKDMEKAQAEVKEELSKLELPEGVEEPEISRLSLNAFPIMSLSISDSKQSLEELTKTVEETVLPEIEGVEGISSAQISGQEVKEVHIQFDDQKMKQYGLQEETVKNMIKGSSVTMPLGLYTFKNTEKSVVVDGNIANLEDLKTMKIPAVPSAQEQAPPGGMSPSNPPAAGDVPSVELQDIASIELTGEAESISRTNGETSIGMQIVKAADANTVDVVNAVKEKVKELEKEIDGLKITTIFDQGEPIEKSVETMLSKAIFGAIFAVLIILLFLRNFRTTVISVISIPLSLLIAILLLKQMDITLNMMTLGAMTVAIGRVIDDSIVVIENIFRRMSLADEKLSGKELIVAATKQMFVPIASSTIVTIAVFLPLGLVKGPVGEMFLPFALTIVFSLLASLLIAITIVPLMAHSLFKKELAKGLTQKEKKPSRLAAFYKRVLNWSLNHKVITSAIAVLLLVGSLALVPIIGVSFLPSDEEKMVVATYKPEPGQTLDEVEKVAGKAEKLLKERDQVVTYQFSAGGENPMNPGDSNSAMFFVEYDKDTKDFEKEKENVIKDLQKLTDKGEWASQDFSGMGASNSLSMLVYGETEEDIQPVVAELEAVFQEHSSLKNVKTSLSESYEEYTLKANQEKLSKLGLTAAQIGMGLSDPNKNQVLTTVKESGKEIEVYVQADKEEYQSIDDLTKQTIQSPLGMEVPIKEVTEVKEGRTSDTVTRRNGRIYAEVSGEITSKDVAKVSADIQKEADQLKLPANVELSMGGVTEDINESFTQLGLAMLAAIAIVYLILVITFGGALAPFAILFSLPFTIIGGLVGLLVAGETLSVSAMIGALMLIGIVVTNAIVLVDRVIHKENEGMSTREALLEAGGTRLRPILMTAIATIGALAPLAVGLEGSGLISKGLGVTVIGGLTSSTLLTLLIVPIVYESLMKVKKRIKKTN
ncbi:efflux RND transporter permease subunit [Bacillus xiapuensis]|uniref:efflux RND transporter permease subunit n=1 Tax=Bacillus xiapuensis TaxID=2014075 RepID=UPI000C238F34|nr:efflux RND transporter permease subunit [Bacillus xiapuensis]